MTRLTMQRPPAARRRPAPGGFTLTELLIVIALAVLILALAVPAFSVITGGRSVESAENRIAAYLGAARSDAIGLQQPRGVIFFEDPGTRLMTMAQVSLILPTTVVKPGDPLQLELYPNRDEMALPTGVGLQGVPNGGGNYPWQVYAVVMFDGDGRLLQDPFKIVAGSYLDKRLPKSGPNAITSLPTNTQPNIGFTLFDRPAYEEQVGTGPQKTWLDNNAVPYLVNRFNGSLLRAE